VSDAGTASGRVSVSGLVWVDLRALVWDWVSVVASEGVSPSEVDRRDTVALDTVVHRPRGAAVDTRTDRDKRVPVVVGTVPVDTVVRWHTRSHYGHPHDHLTSDCCHLSCCCCCCCCSSYHQ